MRSTLRAVVFIATAAAIYSLGHGLRTFTGMPRSTQPSTLRGLNNNSHRDGGWWVLAVVANFRRTRVISFYTYGNWFSPPSCG